jgi:hypothetical protein
MRYNNIEKFSEILNYLNEQIPDLIVIDTDFIHFEVINDILTEIVYYDKHKDIYSNKPTNIVSKFEETLDKCYTLIMDYIRNYIVKRPNQWSVENGVLKLTK